MAKLPVCSIYRLLRNTFARSSEAFYIFLVGGTNSLLSFTLRDFICGFLLLF